MSENIYNIAKSSFLGSKEIFSSGNKKDVAVKLIELNAYKQPVMRDAGYVLFQNHEKLDIDAFVKQNLSETEITTALSQLLIYGFRGNHTEVELDEDSDTSMLPCKERPIHTDDKSFTPPLISCKGGSGKKIKSSLFPNGIVFDEW